MGTECTICNLLIIGTAKSVKFKYGFVRRPVGDPVRKKAGRVGWERDECVTNRAADHRPMAERLRTLTLYTAPAKQP